MITINLKEENIAIFRTMLKDRSRDMDMHISCWQQDIEFSGATKEDIKDAKESIELCNIEKQFLEDILSQI